MFKLYKKSAYASKAFDFRKIRSRQKETYVTRNRIKFIAIRRVYGRIHNTTGTVPKALRFPQIIFFLSVFSRIVGTFVQHRAFTRTVQPSASIFDCLRKHALAFFHPFSPISSHSSLASFDFLLAPRCLKIPPTVLLEALTLRFFIRFTCNR